MPGGPTSTQVVVFPLVHRGDGPRRSRAGRAVAGIVSQAIGADDGRAGHAPFIQLLWRASDLPAREVAHGSPATFGQQCRQTSRCVSSGESGGGGTEKTTAPTTPQFGHLLLCLRAGVVPLGFVSCWLSSGRWGLFGIWAPKALGGR